MPCPSRPTPTIDHRNYMARSKKYEAPHDAVFCGFLLFHPCFPNIYLRIQFSNPASLDPDRLWGPPSPLSFPQLLPQVGKAVEA
jgi:hypothetical protein